MAISISYANNIFPRVIPYFFSMHKQRFTKEIVGYAHNVMVKT